MNKTEEGIDWDWDGVGMEQEQQSGGGHVPQCLSVCLTNLRGSGPMR